MDDKHKTNIDDSGLIITCAKCGYPVQNNSNGCVICGSDLDG